MTRLASSLFEPTLQKTYTWLNEISEKLHWEDRQQAYHALRAVLHALRDRLPVEVAAHLSAQLPLLIRGVFFEGWEPSKVPVKITTKKEFYQLVKKHAENQNIENQVERVVIAVFDVLNTHIDVGEIADILSDLPRELRELFYSRKAA